MIVAQSVVSAHNIKLVRLITLILTNNQLLPAPIIIHARRPFLVLTVAVVLETLACAVVLDAVAS